MTVFISHSFDDRPEFENIVDALERHRVEYWDLDGIKAGDEPLRDQLRTAVQQCSVCVFIATHNSVRSSWCGAELGAFWGAGRPIVVYSADSSLRKADLPPIVEGDVWERNLTRVAERASELSRTLDGAGPGLSGTTRLTAMTAADLQRLIAGAVSLVNAGRPAGSRGAGADLSLESLVEDAAGQVLRGAEATRGLGGGADQVWRRRILWVDDRPDRKTYERGVFESVGLEIETALSTDEALAALRRERFAAIISDMGRREGQQEGYRLLELVRKDDKRIPYFIYSGSRTPEHRREAAERGAQGATNTASELLEMVTSTLGSSRFP